MLRRRPQASWGQLGKCLVSWWQPPLSHSLTLFPTPQSHTDCIIISNIVPNSGEVEKWSLNQLTLHRSKGSGRWDGSNQETVSDLITRLGNKAMISISSHKVTNSPNITQLTPHRIPGRGGDNNNNYNNNNDKMRNNIVLGAAERCHSHCLYINYQCHQQPDEHWWWCKSVFPDTW